MNQQKIIQTIKMVLAVAVLTIGTTYALAVDWTAPPVQPPGCPNSTPGCNVPINTGVMSQIKLGGLGIGGLFSTVGKTVIGHGAVAPTIAESLKLKVVGKVGAEAYCDQDGNNCSVPPFGSGGGISWWGQVADTGRIENLNNGRVEINGKVKIMGGHPATDKVLASTDDTGIAKWKTLGELGVNQGFNATCDPGEAISAINTKDNTFSCIKVPNSSSGGGGILQLFFGGGSGGGTSGQCYESSGSCRIGYYRSATIPGQYSCHNVTSYGPPNCEIGKQCTKQVCTTDDTTYQCCPR